MQFSLIPFVTHIGCHLMLVTDSQHQFYHRKYGHERLTSHNNLYKSSLEVEALIIRGSIWKLAINYKSYIDYCIV